LTSERVTSVTKIFREFDQKELDAQYNNRAHVPDYEDYYERWKPACAEVLTNFQNHLDLPYGSGARERIDLILPEGRGPHPIQLYIHGGYWMSRSKSDQTFLAKPFVETGVAFGLIEYDLIPDVRINDIVRQCRTAAAWIHENAHSYGLDANHIYVSGHSAGGHLTAMLALTDWTAFGEYPTNLMKGGCAISGIYNLNPIKLSYMQEVLSFNDREVVDNSPMLSDNVPKTPLIITVGAAETDEFRRQSKAFSDDWHSKGGNCSFMEQSGRNHFSILDELGDREGKLVQSILTQIGIR
tara:strand:- start:1374 stop:2264 length:891 start_codon:yes stop_codon:yes gene_type:complete